MMNYEIFKEVVKDSFKDYLPEQYKDMELRVCSVNKVNRMMDGINLIGGSEVKNVSPAKAEQDGAGKTDKNRLQAADNRHKEQAGTCAVHEQQTLQ